jgi:hypothetical protein
MCGAELRELDEAWKEIDKIKGRHLQKLLGLTRCSANSMGEMELGGDSRRGKAMHQAVKYWRLIAHIDIQDLVTYNVMNG